MRKAKHSSSHSLFQPNLHLKSLMIDLIAALLQQVKNSPMHLTNDMINGLWELCGSLFLFRNSQMLWRDKMVKGVSILPTIYFFGWGIWNLFWYPSLHQFYSFMGGITIMAANCLWIVLMLYFKFLYKPEIKQPEPEHVPCNCHSCGNPFRSDDMVFTLSGHIVHANMRCAWEVSKQNEKTYRNRTPVPYQMVPDSVKLAQAQK
jgi:hypothetical protein